MGDITMLDTSVFGALNRAKSAAAIAKDLLQMAANGETLMVGASAYQEILNDPNVARRTAQLQQIKDFKMQVQSSTMTERIGGIGDDFVKTTVKEPLGAKYSPSPVQMKDLPIASDVKVQMARTPNQKVRPFTVERMADQKVDIKLKYGIELSDRARRLGNLGEPIPYEPQKLGVKPAAAAPVAEIPPPAAPEVPAGKPSGSGAGPKSGSGLTAAKILQGVKEGFKQGLKDLVSPESLIGLGVSLAAMGLQSYADIVAAETAIKRIEIFFIKEGFAKGYAAAACGWTDEELTGEAMNRVTHYRVQGMGDAGKKLGLDYILKLAETYENYGVAVGFVYASRRPASWKKEVRERGSKRLKSSVYNNWRGDPSVYLFKYEFLTTLAWALRGETDAIVGPAIRTGKKPAPSLKQ
jgi:hypothetical protein